MNRQPTIEKQLNTLSSYHDWQTASSAQKEADTSRPRQISLNDRDHLRSQIAYLDAQEGQLEARQTLMEEIALQDSRFLPLAYRLGLLAAFEATKYEPRTTQNIFQIDSSEQPINPSDNPVTRAVQIGDELARIRGFLLDSRRTVPVAMVWNHYFHPPREDYDVVVVGEIIEPVQALEFSEPSITIKDEVKVIEFTVPTSIKNVTRVRTVGKPERTHEERGSYENPDVPVLCKLVGSRKQTNVNALYIGEEAVGKRVAKAGAADAAAAYRKKLRSDRRGRRPIIRR